VGRRTLGYGTPRRVRSARRQNQERAYEVAAGRASRVRGGRRRAWRSATASDEGAPPSRCHTDDSIHSGGCGSECTAGGRQTSFDSPESAMPAIRMRRRRKIRIDADFVFDQLLGARSRWDDRNGSARKGLLSSSLRPDAYTGQCGSVRMRPSDSGHTHRNDADLFQQSSIILRLCSFVSKRRAPFSQHREWPVCPAARAVHERCTRASRTRIENRVLRCF